MNGRFLCFVCLPSLSALWGLRDSELPSSVGLNVTRFRISMMYRQTDRQIDRQTDLNWLLEQPSTVSHADGSHLHKSSIPYGISLDKKLVRRRQLTRLSWPNLHPNSCCPVKNQRDNLNSILWDQIWILYLDFSGVLVASNSQWESLMKFKANRG